MNYNRNVDSRLGNSNDFSREIVFIQAGPASNWIGTHFWNLQENILFQKQETSPFLLPAFFRGSEKSSSYLRPRLISIDTLGSVRSPGMGIGEPSPGSNFVAWEDSVQIIRQDDRHPLFDAKSQQHYEKHKSSEVSNERQEGNETTRRPTSRQWMDCLLPTVKRRWAGEETLMVLHDYLDSSGPGDVFASPRLSNDVTTRICENDAPQFASFAQGLDLFREGSDTFDHFENYFHRLVEECDRPSGFFLLVDSDSGFSGVALRLGGFLGEEFTKRPVFTSAIASCISFNQPRRWSTVCLNRLALFAALEHGSDWPSCSAWLPLANIGDACVASSLLAAGMTTALSPLMLKHDLKYSVDLNGFVIGLTPTRKKMLSLSFANQNTKMADSSKMEWIHTSTLKTCSKPTEVRQCNAASHPNSLVCQLSIRGIEKGKEECSSLLPHPTGHACTLSKGLSPRLSCSLPTHPLTVPRLTSAPSFCTQPTYSCTRAVIEAVSHWTDENQWLASGLKHHFESAFCNKFDCGYVETDELNEIKETATDRLVEAYASADG
uniref:Misat_Tub_SegII domain-containing protein n=1 Tax=Mesocestoides corti TaxID=53468 RepID=A0A5K3EIY4_MESCO